MTEECMVLLKNEQSILPLKQGMKLFVCGPNANSFRAMNGGWTYTWQGNKTNEIAAQIGKYRTFLGALEQKFGQENVTFSELVLLFISDLVASLTPDIKRLRAFTKVQLAPHETKTVNLSVRVSDLAFVNEDMQWVLEPGQFRATIGNQHVEFTIE